MVHHDLLHHFLFILSKKSPIDYDRKVKLMSHFTIEIMLSKTLTIKRPINVQHHQDKAQILHETGGIV